jgi:hypothetical protein
VDSAGHPHAVWWIARGDTHPVHFWPEGSLLRRRDDDMPQDLQVLVGRQLPN